MTPLLNEATQTRVIGELGLVEVLSLRGFDVALPTRVVRHQDDRYPVDVLRRRGWFETYQRYQKRPVFHKCQQIISLYGLAGTRCAFDGVYRVEGVTEARNGVVLNDCPWSGEWRQIAEHFYDLRRDPRFDIFRERIIVEWGPATRSWVQKIDHDKQVLEVLPPGRKLPPFDDYLEFTLSFQELKDLYENEDAHREWRARLSAVGGVYLILAATTGRLYLGSATGDGGIWQRWSEYAKTSHGGNVLLKQLVDSNDQYPESFRFSILQIVPKTMAREEVIARETLYKEKLGSRAIGLNAN